MSQNGGNGDTIQNCILEVCCGGDDGRQVRALTQALQHDLPLPHEEAQRVARWVASHYDLAPKGSLYAFKQEIARLARGPAYQE